MQVEANWKGLALTTASSGNSNFEVGFRPTARTNYFSFPPIVVAYNLASRLDIDFKKGPTSNGKDMYLLDI
jgi:aconitate hydratase